MAQYDVSLTVLKELRGLRTWDGHRCGDHITHRGVAVRTLGGQRPLEQGQLEKLRQRPQKSSEKGKLTRTWQGRRKGRTQGTEEEHLICLNFGNLDRNTYPTPTSLENTIRVLLGLPHGTGPLSTFLCISASKTGLRSSDINAQEFQEIARLPY